MPTFPKQRPPRRHRWDPRTAGHSATPVPPAPPVDVTLVGVDHGHEFDWYLYWEFSGPLPPALTLADVQGLRSDGIAPTAITDRGTNWLVLRCPCDNGVGSPWLVLPGGSPAFVPGQTGTVQEI